MTDVLTRRQLLQRAALNDDPPLARLPSEGEGTGEACAGLKDQDVARLSGVKGILQIGTCGDESDAPR